MDRPEAVFVYGTLKRGERNFAVAKEAGWLRSVEAYIEGFQLFHLPRQRRLGYSYPAVVPGEGRVWGEIQWFADLERALDLLDALEDEGREYLRKATLAYPLAEAPPCWVWVYVYPSRHRVQAASGRWLPAGVWREAEGVD
ncbi:gamma-glutamylcyclotransferase family protein [Meiothermus rufus]|uniref:gamma-glutamylcyclotransferase family protein n=1 Tax=Meiothermus rufus TaxID=604332 RepID=UPI00047F02F5|nr:gamma-glutamylcyclotransferase family protein [Meiothermus rufus]